MLRLTEIIEANSDMVTLDERAKILSEALPYILKYKDKVMVIKYGGNAMIDENLKALVMEDIVMLNSLGIKVVLVHGGGPEISAMLKKIGTNARYEMERLLDCKVNLKLWVKVKKDWRDSDFLIKNFGYREDQ